MTDRELGQEYEKQPMKPSAIKARRKFDDTFKREAVQHWLSSGKSAELIASELGIQQERLYAWKRRFAPAAAGAASLQIMPVNIEVPAPGAASKVTLTNSGAEAIVILENFATTLQAVMNAMLDDSFALIETMTGG